MSKAKHTPGKWREYDGDIVSESDIKGDIICSAPLGFPKSMKRWEANACLIAASPEMYELLVDIVATMERMAPEPKSSVGVHLKKTKELIKKIEG